MSKNEVSHEGTILEITPEFTTVEIIAQSACAACHARGLCGVADEKQKIIMVPTDPYGSYKEGDKVLVLLKKSMGMKAGWPCITLSFTCLEINWPMISCSISRKNNFNEILR